MLKAVFYTRFHQDRGRTVVHQHPSNTIVASAGADADTLVSFADIASYIIAPYELCNRPLSIVSNGHRVLGYPVSLEDAEYERNRFTFNVSFVFDEHDDLSSWQQIVRKTALFFTALERDDNRLTTEENLPGLKRAGETGYPARGTGLVHSLLETIYEHLNAFGETCARIDDLHVLNLRLEHPEPMPPKVHAWDVPLLIRPLPAPEQWTWPLTLQRIAPHVDGVKHVQRIAELADVELKLVRRGVRELIYHGRAMLLDIFHFQAIYVATADLAWFAKDSGMVEECCRYVGTERTSPSIDGPLDLPTPETLITLYSSLSPGVLLQDFVLAREKELTNIDIRRFITFGIIKGFVRRVHKFALAIDTPASTHLTASGSSPSKSKPKSNEDAVREFDRAWKRAALTSGWATPPPEPPAIAELSKSNRSTDELRTEQDEKLRGYLDGRCCLDQICLEMRMGEGKVVERLRSGRLGEVVLFNK
ncbi:nitrogen permease regulator 2 [Teratosphaeria destructans]|uniref:Nitrogen permease regulator 2 n=1 Tax=Teratosphaeria destructans TaxID=418781 RepID=A0A9W7SW31_9PEZI|nr:nitrogen permease regulator 2 [Teratosphaeria destructans]